MQLGKWSDGWRVCDQGAEARHVCRKRFRQTEQASGEGVSPSHALIARSSRSWFVIKTKISPIPSGRDAKAVAKGAAQGIGALETDGGGDGIDREVLGRQTPSRFIQPAVLHEGAG